MTTQDVIAQLRQDITAARDAGDDEAVRRLRGELDIALHAAGVDPDQLPLEGTGTAPQPPDAVEDGTA
ncbi:hypothetical protein IU433_04565 [Nocardia puris]|uniref:Uncharacterized protein n=1 Tax=Nocardia puris TaxID=208602 RepID=A0A366DWK5_9NOCA|nr:hypothetical protein [Nocardia puris]MBF6209773.1 hypothetical protein [Nocardia puris]MBF6366345.1 hypothetical protein [Nocardia puris]MBF6458316.1 hypothetical protein [Nocardia puris]RBO94491.1 hypothetical protein DFR74_102914 [Nocardia puris]